MKKLKPLISILLAAFIAFNLPVESVYADFNGFRAGLTVPKSSGGGTKPTPTKNITKPKTPQPDSHGYTQKHVGWRMYLITADDNDGNVNPRPMDGTDVIDVVGDTCYLDEIDAAALWTRVGDGEVARWKSPISIAGSTMPTPLKSNAQSWFKNKGSDGVVNAMTVIKYYWGADVANHFKDTTEHHFLVMEPIHWSTVISTLAVDKPYRDAFGPDNKDHMFYGTNYSWLMYLQLLGINTSSYGYKTNICRRMPITAMFEKDWLQLKNTTAVYQPIADYKALSFGDIGDYAFAIQAFRNSDLAHQSTYDNVSTDPSVAPKESEGKWYIHKTYRTKRTIGGTVTYEGNGQFTRSAVHNVIDVEEEMPPTEWKVTAWKTSTSTPVTLDYDTWNVPSPVQSNTPANLISTVTMANPGSEQTLFVLLERAETTPPTGSEADYVVKESQITKGIDIDVSESGTINGRNVAETSTTNKETSDHRWTGTAREILANYKFRWKLHAMKCNGHSYSYVSGHNDDGSEIHSSATAYCKLYLNDRHLDFDVINKFRNNYPKNLAVAAWKDWTSPGVRSGQDKEYIRKGAGEGTRKIEEEESDEYEFKYRVTLHRGEDSLTFAEWKNGGAGPISGLSTFHKANTPGGTRKDLDWDKSDLHINLIQKPNGDSAADLLTIAKGTATGHGATRGNCTKYDYASLENPFSATLHIKYLAYAGKDVGGSINSDCETYDASNPTHKFSGGDRWKAYDKDTGNMTDQSIQYSFYPYIMMRYDSQNMSNFTRDNTTYVLGQYTRGMKLNDFAEFMWNDPGSLTNPNLRLSSDQWTTHATVQNDIHNNVIKDGLGTTTALPGGALLHLNIETAKEKVVECVTFQCKLADDSEAYTADGQGGQTQVDKTGSESASQTLDEIKTNHEDYVQSIIDTMEVFKVDQYVNKDSQANPFDGKYVYNGADISSLGTTAAGAGHASMEDKYYVKADDDLGKSTLSQESDLDVAVANYSSGNPASPEDDILGNTDIQKYTFWADVKGNIWMNNELCLSQAEFGHDQIHSAIAKKIDTRTGVVVKMAEALERNTGYDTDATWIAPHWYNEAFDGVTVVVCSTKLRIGYRYPGIRTEVLDPKLVPKPTSDTTGGQADIGVVDSSNHKKNYLVSAFRTEKDPGQSGVDDLVGQFKSVSVVSRDMETFYVTKKFFIPAMTTQDLK